MRAGALLGLLVAACSNGTGADVEIRADVPLTKVEVFVGAEYCVDEACKHGIGWTDGQPAPPQRRDSYADHVYFSVADEEGGLELHPRAEPDGSIWQLHLDADRTNNAYKIIIVGYDDQQNAMVGVIDESIPLNSEVHWTVTLDRADNAQLANMSAPADTDPQVRVATWGRDGVAEDAARCVVLQTWSYDHWHGTYIVPQSDPDCDGEAMVECDPYYFNLNQGISVCAGRRDTGDSPCILGIPTCEDGQSATDSCLVNAATVGPRVCVPDAICDQCSGPYGLRQCVGDVVRENLVSHPTCRFGFSESNDMTCTRGFVGSQAYLGLPYRCADVEIRTLSNALAPASGVKTVTIGEASFAVEMDPNALNNCKLIVTFEEGTADRGDSNWVILAVTPANYTGTRILVPLEIVFEDFGSDCAQMSGATPCDTATFLTDTVHGCGF